MTQNPEEHNDLPPEDNQEETLAERSARLEAEAQAMADSAVEDAMQEGSREGEEDIYSDDDPLNVPEGNIESLALQTELAEAKDKMIRAVAEAENTRRRAVKERDDARKYSIGGFSKDIISVADNLHRALQAIPPELLAENDQVKNLVDGIAATERELLRAFEKNNITKFVPDLEKAEIFNPNKHEVMFEAPGTGQPAGTIIQVIDPGYLLHDRLIRPARVGVAKDDGGPPPETVGIDTEA